MFDREQYLMLARRIREASDCPTFNESMAVFGDIMQDLQPIYRGKVLYSRGLVKREYGFTAEAMGDWLDALGDLEGKSFLRYQVETALGEAEEGMGEAAKAIGWYRRAIRTCSEAGDFVGSLALDRYLHLNNGVIPTEDQALVASALKSSWQTLEVPGSLDHLDLPRSIRKLRDSFEKKVEEAKFHP